MKRSVLVAFTECSPDCSAASAALPGRRTAAARASLRRSRRTAAAASEWKTIIP